MPREELTEQERVTLINAVQTFVGRLDRVIPDDVRPAAYRAAVRLVLREYQMRYATPMQAAPVQAPRYLPGPPMPYPPAWRETARE
jgi:hypothetical protein